MMNRTPPTSNQDAFNRIWEFFVVEGHNQSKSGNFCAYRGEVKGEACAVGCMMPAAMARKADKLALSGDNSSILNVRNEFPSVEEWFENVGLDFLEEAQSKHDNEDFNTQKVPLLTALAEDFGLTIPAATLGDLTKGRNRVLTEAK